MIWFAAILLIFCSPGGGKSGEPLNTPGRSESVLHAEAIKDLVRESLCRGMKDTSGEVEVEFLRVPDSLVLPSSDYAVRIGETGLRRSGGTQSVFLEVCRKGQVEGRVPVSLAVRTYGMVVVAARTLERHAVLAPSDVRLQRVETTHLPAGTALRVDETIGLRTRRIITGESIVYRAMLESVPLVLVGDLVTLKCSSGPVTLSLPAIAREDGRKGDIISVQKEGSHERLKGRITDAKSVELVSR